MSNEIEKDLNDEVYEDSFYDSEEELVEDDDEKEDDKEEKEEFFDDDDEEKAQDSDDIDAYETRLPVSFACDDCDYRWDDVIIKKGDDLNEDDDIAATCPMCGSMNVSQI